MPRMIIDIAPMVADFGEFIDFFTQENQTLVRGIVTQGAFTKVVAHAAVFPHNPQSLDITTQGANLHGSKQVFCKTYFPLSNYSESPTDTRMRYEGATYRLIARKAYPGNYYVYVAEQLRVDPDALPV